MVKHPFNEGTNLAKTFTILSDCEWHCGKCELPGTQPAKPIQVIRQHGFDIQKKTMLCQACGVRTVHRKLVSTEPARRSFVRQILPRSIRERVLVFYGRREAITQREMVADELEVDHRFPQVRWSKDEASGPEMSDEQLRRKFQLLTRSHNLWKSRYCEHCRQTGERGTFIGIDFFYKGGSHWDPKIPADNELGCEGCFWYDPDKWRKALNDLAVKGRKNR